MPLSEQQWTCECGYANSFVRTKCRGCRKMKAAEARLEPTPGLPHAHAPEGEWFCGWHGELNLLLHAARQGGMSAASVKAMEQRLSEMKASADAFDRIASSLASEKAYAAHEPGRKFQADTFGIVARGIVESRLGRRNPQ